MTVLNITNCRKKDKIEVTCDDCGKIFLRIVKNIIKSRFNFNKDVCLSCACKITSYKKPQCTSIYWNKENKERLGTYIKNSLKYKNGIKNRKDTGENNSMFGKKHSIFTKLKMSISRTGKIGENSTAWKGGKNSLCRRVKGFQYRNEWYSKIYKRDNYKCAECSSKDKIEIHHIKPIKTIVDEIKNNFSTDDERYLYLIQLEIILDPHLLNGITLCRKCHIKAHLNMGSHNPKTK